MPIVPRGDVDYPVEFSGAFTLTDAEFETLTYLGRSPRAAAVPHAADVRLRWERLIIQYVERATLRRPEYKALKAQLAALAKAVVAGQTEFAEAYRKLDVAAVEGSDERESPSWLRPAEIDVSLDIVESELNRQLGNQWPAALGDTALDLEKVEQVLRHAVDDLVKDHGGPGRRRHPDVEWFIDQAAELFATIGGNVAANGRDLGSLRGGPFVRVVEEALAIAAKHAGHDKIRAKLPSVGNLGQLVLEVIEKRKRTPR